MIKHLVNYYNSYHLNNKNMSYLTMFSNHFMFIFQTKFLKNVDKSSLQKQTYKHKYVSALWGRHKICLCY